MELVYVVRRRDLFERESIQGFRALSGETLSSHFLRPIAARGFFVERRHAEQDSSLKQIIPYCVVVARPQAPAGRTPASGTSRATRDGVPNLRALCLRRLPKQGEMRLHRKLSIGIGGHLDPIDAEQGREGVVARGARREIEEELVVEGPQALAIGVLNDDSTPVGSVHFGVVHLVEASEDLSVRETDAMTGSWIAWENLRARALGTPPPLGGTAAPEGVFESWSQLVLAAWSADALEASLDAARPRKASVPARSSRSREVPKDAALRPERAQA